MSRVMSFYASFEMTPVPQVLVDRAGRVCRVNAAFRRVFAGVLAGAEEADLSVERVLEGGGEGLARMGRRLVETGSGFHAADVRLRLGAAGSARMDVHGEPLSESLALITWVDFTNRVSEATSLARRNRTESVARFASGLAHDINNLLAAIMATAQAGCSDLNDGVGDPRADFQAIIDEAERGAALARELKALAFDETGSLRPVDVGVEIRGAAALLARGNEHVQLTVEIRRALPGVVGDRARLHQVFFNLLLNAVEAVDSAAGERKVRVSVRETESGGLEVVVSDSGPGIDEELKDRIFQPYFTTKKREQGTKGPARGRGLGLAIVDAVVRATGGEIAVERDRELGGARVCLTWQAGSVVPVVATDEAPRSLERQPALILLADNEVALVGAMARQLRRAGHTVYAALSAEEAGALFDQYADVIDAAVLDVRLGDGDGRELAKGFRERRPDLGVVLISASKEPERDAGRSWLRLVKPFAVHELTSAIEASLTIRGDRAERGRESAQ